MRTTGTQMSRLVASRIVVTAVVAFVLSACTGTESVTIEGASVPQELATTATTVPDTLGSTLTDARSALEAAGLGASISKEEREDDDPGTVVDQDPAAGTSADPGTTVSLTVAIAPVPVGRAARLTLDPTTSMVVLTWDAPRFGSPVEGYEIWRDGKKVGRRTAAHRTFTDTGLSSGSTHRYVIVSLGKNGTTHRSVPQSATLDVPAPDPIIIVPPAPPPPPPPPPIQP